MLDVLYKDRDVIAVLKPAGMPTQPDKSGDTDVMTLLSEQLSSQGEPSALYLVHRLDRVVGGILVFARNKKSAAALCAMAASDGMKKEYIAVTDAYLEGGVLVDMLKKDSRISKAVVTDSRDRDAKRAELELTPLATVGGKSLVKVKLITGRYHQIRAQLSSRGAPICADGKYGSRDRGARFPALFAFGLSFSLGEKRLMLKKMPDTDEYPWSVFKEIIKNI